MKSAISRGPLQAKLLAISIQGQGKFDAVGRSVTRTRNVGFSAATTSA